MLKRLRGWYLACLVAALALYAGGLALNVSTDDTTLGSGFVNWVKGLPSIGNGGNGGGPGNGGTGNNGGGGTGNNGNNGGGGTGNNGGGNNNGGTDNNGGTGNNGNNNGGTGNGGNNGGTGTTPGGTGTIGGGGPTGKGSTTPTTAPEDQMDADHGFRYGLLDESLQGHYDVMLESLRNKKDRFDIEGLTASNLDSVYQAVVLDHPELSWQSSSYTYYDNGDSVELLPSYVLATKKLKSLEKKIEAAADDALSGLASDASDYEKVKYCYEWIVNNTDYVHSKHDQTIRGVLMDHKAVCAGYSRTMQYLLAKVGVQCCYVSGKAVDGDLHAWNLLWIDGTPTYVDVTWGDPVTKNDDGSVSPGNELIYDYLGLTTKEMNREHIAWDPEKPMLPICKSPKYNYYRQSGLYMKTFDKGKLAALVQDAENRGETSVRFKVAGKKQQKAALDFVSSSEVYSCLPEGVSGMTYTDGGDIYTVGIDWQY